MKVLLLRHGKTAGNFDRRYIGRTDEPLCKTGIEEVLNKGVFASVMQVYVSPLLRARETACLLFPNARQVIIDDLREMDFGGFEGKTADELGNDLVYRSWVEGGCLSACPEGESLGQFMERTCNAFLKIINEAIARGEKQVIVVAHGGSIMAVMSRFADSKRAYFQWHVENCCGYCACLDDKSWTNKPVLTSIEYTERIIL